MPRVLRIINRFNLGGPTYNASYLTKYLSPEFETLLVGGMNDATEANSLFIPQSLGLEPTLIPEMRRSINPAKDLAAFKSLKRIIREFKPDIVHTHASKAGALGRRAAASLNVPVIVHTFHGHVFDAYFSGLKSGMYKRIERSLAKKSHCIIALSEIQKNDLVIKHRICDEGKVRIIPLGFDLSRFREKREEKRAAFRHEYHIDDDEVAIGIVGRIVPIKNHELFIRGIHFVKQHTSKKIRAFIVGDGESRTQIEQLAGELGLDMVDATTSKKKATISFTSWLKDIDVVNAGMDIIALTSLNEGTPVSLIEAQASGKPVVTTRVGGIENIVSPEQTALLSNSGDVAEFGRNLIRLIDSRDLRDQLGGAGWNFVSERFDVARLANDVGKLYRELLMNGRLS